MILLPLAAHRERCGPRSRLWKWVGAFALLEMAGPWLLLGHAEIRVTSGFAGLMLATVPLFGVLIARLRGDPHAFAPVRLRGLGVGIVGVACLVGIDSLTGRIDLLSVRRLLLVAVGYAAAPVIANTVLAEVPSIGVIAVSVTIVAALYLPWTAPRFAGRHRGLRRRGGPVVVLGLVCTALAFVLFFRLIALAGPVRATVITFINPAVAIGLGLLVLGEPLTWGMVLGFPLVLLGAYWATRTPVSPAA